MKRQRGFVIPAPLIAFALKYGVYFIVGAIVLTSAIVAVKHYNESLRETGRKEVQAKWDAAIAEQAEKERAQSATASTNLEADRVKTRTVYRTITKSVDKYIDRPIYRNVCFDEPGMRDANAALIRKAPATDTGKPDAAVPAADGAGKRDGRDGAAKTD